MFVTAMIVFAGVYIAGSALEINILHTVALLGAVGTLMAAFMGAALRVP